MNGRQLNRVHRQRIGVAVKAAQEGGTVVFAVDWNFNTFANGRLVWRCEGRKHVIANGSKHAMDELLPLAQAEFQAQLIANAELEPDELIKA